ncbi:MAG: hypothetical protein H0U23_10300 [Blastocatellia bacterium]|nr:hypothetical protein [Blastocatellia bacterium]
MKIRIISMLAILAVFGLAIAAYAYTQNQTTTTGSDKACCSKGSESCPMKAKGHDDKGEHAGMSCDKMNSHSSELAKAEGHECCSCCGDSCPMKKKEGSMAAISASTTDDTNACCDNCECCNGKGEDEVKSEV